MEDEERRGEHERERKRETGDVECARIEGDTRISGVANDGRADKRDN